MKSAGECQSHSAPPFVCPAKRHCHGRSTLLATEELFMHEIAHFHNRFVDSKALQITIIIVSSPGWLNCISERICLIVWRLAGWLAGWLMTRQSACTTIHSNPISHSWVTCFGYLWIGQSVALSLSFSQNGTLCGFMVQVTLKLS